MSNYTRDLQADFVDFTTVDNNVKLVWDVILKLAPEGDEFGNIWDAVHWAVQDDYFGVGTPGNTWTEVGGIIKPDIKGGVWRTAQKRLITYGDADVFQYVSDTKAGNLGKLSQIEFMLWLDVDNLVMFTYRPRLGAGSKDFIVGKWINRAWLTLKQTPVGIIPQLWFRIKRLITAGPFPNYFYFYFATADPVAVPANWQLYWWGQITGATFNNTHLLHPLLAVYSDADVGFIPERDYYRQCGDIPAPIVLAQRFWPDSPECNVVNSGAGAVEWCLDAGVGKLFTLTTFSAVKNDAGGSVEFRAAFNNAPDRATATWIQGGVWLTETELNDNVADLNGNRYVFLQTQFNSTSLQQPTLTSITFSDIIGENWIWWKPDADPLGTYIIVASPWGPGNKAIKINSKSLAGLYNGKVDFNDCEIVSLTKVEVDTKSSEFYMRWNPTATGDGYLIVITDDSAGGGKKAEVFNVVAGVKNLLVASTPSVEEHLEWNKWRIRIVDIGSPPTEVKITVEVLHWDGIAWRWDLLIDQNSSVVKPAGYLGFGQVYSLGEPLFDNISLKSGG